MTLTPIFDSSVTSRSDAAAIEQAINAAAGQLSSAFSNAATVRFNVSWGSVQGQAIPSGDVASSIENLSGPYTFSTLLTDFRSVAAANPYDSILQAAVAHLPKTNPAGALTYKIPYGEAQAMGLLPATLKLAAGGIGFSTGFTWDTNRADGITTGAYDLQGAATHEIMEILGRISGLQSASPSLATPLDLFRYSAVGVNNFSYSAGAYFSFDGGQTVVERFNVNGGGDRSDIASATGLTDVQAAYLPRGVVMTLSAADLQMLDALGWGAYTAPSYGGVVDPYYFGTLQSAAGAAPEPAVWTLMLAGVGGVGALARLRARREAAA